MNVRSSSAARSDAGSHVHQPADRELAGGIECEALSHLYRTGPRMVTALDDISLQIAPRQLAVLLGPSGCGKTTLLNLIAGFLQPTRGEIRVNHRPVGAPSPDRMVVFQSHALFDWMTVEQNVIAGMFSLPTSRREKRDRARELLDLVGLGGFEHSYPSHLSGGMQQRAGVARALAPDPSVLLLDEPFGALDSLTREQLQDDLLSVFEARSVTGVLVTHSIEEAVYLGDVVYVLSSGPGRIADVWTRGQHAHADRSSERFTEDVRDLRRMFEAVVHAMDGGHPTTSTNDTPHTSGDQP